MKKTQLEVQYCGQNFRIKDIETAVKEELKKHGIILKNIDTLNLYLKPSESVVYYVAFDEVGTEITNNFLKLS